MKIPISIYLLSVSTFDSNCIAEDNVLIGRLIIPDISKETILKGIVKIHGGDDSIKDFHLIKDIKLEVGDYINGVHEYKYEIDIIETL